ncbi:MAG: hypothetical protein PVJ17_04165 [Lysobacterales bacterium]|jgi:hypothetical protein
MAATRIQLATRIFHNNGNLRLFVDRRRLQLNKGPVFCRLLEKQLYDRQGPGGQLRRPVDLDIVLCTTHAAKQYTESILEYLGIDDFVVLGRDLQRWRHIYKLKLIVDYIRNHPQPGLLLHLDAPDVLVTGDLQPVVDCFLSDFECDLLFGAEKNSAPGSRTTRDITESEVKFLSRIEEFERSNYQPPFQHLNAGCFIGRKECISDLFSEALSTRMDFQLSSRLHHGDYLYNDDQLVLRELHRKHYPRIQVDHTNKVFQNLYATRRREISTDDILPGGASTVMAYLSHFMFLASATVKRRFRTRRQGFAKQTSRR